MFEDTRPAALEASGGVDPWGPFRVERPSERVALLKQLRDSTSPVLLSAPTGGAMTTTLWTVDEHRGQLSFSANSEPPQLPAIVASNEVVAIAYLDSVKLQFDLHGLVLVKGGRTSALQCLLPQELYRFQRRNGYRVRTLERQAPSAHLRHPPRCKPPPSSPFDCPCPPSSLTSTQPSLSWSVSLCRLWMAR